MSGFGDDSDEALPSAKECSNLCKQFSEITQTNSAEAQMYLQQHGWDLERSIQTYFADTAGDSPVEVDVMTAAKSGDASRIRVLSWNLDGLDVVSLAARTNAALKIIKSEDADVVFLQEVVPQSLDIIKREITALYNVIPADDSTQYFTAVLLRKATVLLDSYKLHPFYTSIMMRNLQIVHANIKGIEVKLMNTHLESTAQHAVERTRQLNTCLKEMTGSDSKYNVIFGGDLNLGARDSRSLSLPSNIADVWEALGSRSETRYTWDTQYNDNKQMSHGGKPRCRFDRIYFRSSDKKNIQPSKFNLLGIERVKDCSRFPSDHWAIICEFNISTE